MRPAKKDFPENARRALGDVRLQAALGNIAKGWQEKRTQAVAALPEFDALRTAAAAIKDHTLAHLDEHLERFESRVTEQGGIVHWCRTAEEARHTILAICHRLNARSVTKGKSMVAEEIWLNDFLGGHGIAPVETDLGEHIIQLRKEAPSHIIAPAVHLTQAQVAETFRAGHHGLPTNRKLGDARVLVEEARNVLRPRYFAAEVGITGANFLVAETGSAVIVTNEGNADLTQLLPKAHIVLAGIEKLVPTLEDAATILRVLARSATGQEMAAYTTFATGPRRARNVDGPEKFHVVLLDNGRSALLGTELQDILRCIRCGACLNHCPVYAGIGGHAYGWVYTGPMGAALTPALLGVAEAGHLPNASTFCGRCESVCPMRIPLPKLMRHWREREFAANLAPPAIRRGLSWWAFFARRPALYRAAATTLARWLALMGGNLGYVRTLPLAGGWTAIRDMPAPSGRTFQHLWALRAHPAAKKGSRP